MTTTSITAVSVSIRSAQLTCRSPETIHGNSANAGVVMHEADIDQRHPRQPRRDQQQSGRDQFGRARSRSRRLDNVMVVVAVVIGGMIVMGIRRVRIAVMLDGVAARIARMRAEDRDQARENRADQRQEYDCLIHPLLSPSSD